MPFNTVQEFDDWYVGLVDQHMGVNQVNNTGIPIGNQRVKQVAAMSNRKPKAPTIPQEKLKGIFGKGGV